MEPTIQIITATTGSSALSGSPQAVIEISNGCFARTFGTSAWTHIRLAMRYRFVSSYAAETLPVVYGTPYRIGFCHGTEHIPGDEYSDNFLGTGMPDDDTLTSVGTNVCYRLDTTFFYHQTSASGYVVANASSWGVSYGRDQVCANTGSGMVLFFDIKKTSVPYTYSASLYSFDTDYVTNRPSKYYYYSDADFEVDIQDPSPSRTSHAQYWRITTIPIDEVASGSFDSVCVYWGRDEPKMQILELYVIRLA